MALSLDASEQDGEGGCGVWIKCKVTQSSPQCLPPDGAPLAPFELVCIPRNVAQQLDLVEAMMNDITDGRSQEHAIELTMSRVTIDTITSMVQQPEPRIRAYALARKRYKEHKQELRDVRTLVRTSADAHTLQTTLAREHLADLALVANQLEAHTIGREALDQQYRVVVNELEELRAYSQRYDLEFLNSRRSVLNTRRETLVRHRRADLQAEYSR